MDTLKEIFEEAKFKIREPPSTIKTKSDVVCRLLTPQYYNVIMSKNNPAFIISPQQVQRLRHIAEFFKFPLNCIFSIYLSFKKNTGDIILICLCLICEKSHEFNINSFGGVRCRSRHRSDMYGMYCWLTGHLTKSHAFLPPIIEYKYENGMVIQESDGLWNLPEKTLIHEMKDYVVSGYDESNNSCDYYRTIFYCTNGSYFCFFCDGYYAIPPADEIILSHLRKCPAINTA